MKVLVLGDLFVTREIMQAALEGAFEGTGFALDYAFYTDRWPAEPLQRNAEVKEFVGDENEIAALAAGAELIVTHSAPVTRKVLDAAPSCRAVGAARGGPVNINIDLCTERGIPVFYAPGSKGGAVAEYTVALMLAEMRNVARSHLSMKEHNRWRGDLYVLDRAGRELGSSTVGIVGYGAIGSRVAQILSGFGARVLVCDPLVPPETITDRGYECVPLDRLLSQSNVVSLHARLTPETKGMIGMRELGLMKPSAYLVNTARAELVVPEALHQALEGHQIAGAALDVFEVEPLPDDHPLRRLDNVTITSHLGGASVQAAENGAAIMAEDLRAFLVGPGQPRYCANASVLGGRPRT